MKFDDADVDPAEVKALLSKLCIGWGFCLPADDCVRLERTPPPEITEFTNTVFVAEGLDPQTADRHLYRQVRAVIAEAFQRHEERDSGSEIRLQVKLKGQPFPASRNLWFHDLPGPPRSVTVAHSALAFGSCYTAG